MQSLEPVKMLPAREQVVNILREAIFTRELREGDRLNLSGLSAQLGVSVTPIREALLSLERDGLVLLAPHKEAVIRGVDEAYIRDYYMTRAVLESAAAGFACEADDLGPIGESFERMSQAIARRDYAAYSSRNQDLHLAIWTAAGNDRMRRLLHSLWISRSLGVRANVEKNAEASFAEHRQVVEAIQARDQAAARDAMFRHLMRSMQNILAQFI